MADVPELGPHINKSTIEQIEGSLCKLRDVIATHITVNNSGNIEEIHVVTKGNRNAKQVVRDVETLLVAELGLVVDHKIISVAQIQDESRLPYVESRYKFSGVNIALSGLSAEVNVTLMKNGTAFTGSSNGPNTTQNRPRLIVSATLDALKHVFKEETTFLLEDLSVVPLGEKKAVVVLLTGLKGRSEKSFTGSALVSDDLDQAVVFATLNGLNRYLGVQRKFESLPQGG